MNCNRCNFNACGPIGVIISILFGALIGVLYVFNLIPNIVITTWIIFGLGVLSLILLFIAVILGAITAPSPISKCLCGSISCLLAGVFGTIIAAIAALSIVLIPATIPAAVFVAIMAFFFALMVIGMISLLYCIVCKTCHPKD